MEAPLLARVATPSKVIVFSFLLFAAGAARTVSGADAGADSAETRLREALRATTLQLRDTQAERDTLAAEKSRNAEDLKTLGAKLDALTKQEASEKAASEKTIAELGSKEAEQETELNQFKAALQKWEAAYKQAAETAQAKEAARAKATETAIGLQREVEELERRNGELFKTANEILTRYEKFSLGQALLSREPFTGITRVKLQNLVQDYHDKLLDQKTETGTLNLRTKN